MPKKGKTKGKHSPKKVSEATRREQAVALRIKGYTFEEIAEAVGYADRASAWNAVYHELAKNSADKVLEMRELEGRRLDAITVALWPYVIMNPPDLDSVGKYLMVSARRARLFGLDVPRELVAAAHAAAEASASIIMVTVGDRRVPLDDLTPEELDVTIEALERKAIAEVVDGEVLRTE